MRCMQRLFSMLNYQRPFNRHNCCSHFCLIFVSFHLLLVLVLLLFFLSSFILTLYLSLFLSHSAILFRIFYLIWKRERNWKKLVSAILLRVTYDYMNNAKADALTEWKWNKWKVQTCTPQTRLHDGKAHQIVWYYVSKHLCRECEKARERERARAHMVKIQKIQQLPSVST